MNWRETTIAELVHIKHGFAFKGDQFNDHGPFVVLTPGNCHNSGGFKDKGNKEKRYSAEVPEGYLMKKGDLMVVMTDLVGTAPVLGGSFIIPEDKKYLHNQRLGHVTIKPDAETSLHFLYYLFNTEFYRGQVRGSASGATVRHTSPGRIGACKVRIPDLPTQQRITSIVSVYDDLIENNRRRIALLKQTSQLLYREWFIHLRFPGHETAKIVDGLPEGWTRCTVEDLLVLQRGFDLPVGDRKDGEVPVYGSMGIVGHHDEAKVQAPVIVTGRSGSLGQVAISDVPCWPLNTALWVKELKGIPPSLAYYILVSLELGKYNGGASVPTLDRKVVHRLPVVRPPTDVVNHFDAIASKNFETVSKLRTHIERLTRARDLMLPRLMDGRLHV